VKELHSYEKEVEREKLPKQLIWSTWWLLYIPVFCNLSCDGHCY
jgi:hypothetical protein